MNLRLKKQVLEEIKEVLKKDKGTKAVIIIGSEGRGNSGLYSDFDFQVLIDTSQFDLNRLINSLNNIKTIRDKKTFWSYISDKKSLRIYVPFENYILSYDIHLVETYNEIDTLFLGSEIENIDNALIYDSTGKLKDYLESIVKQKKENLNKLNKELVTNLVYRFVSYYYLTSRAMFELDTYKAKVNYDNALNMMLRILHIMERGLPFQFMPPFIEDLCNKHGINLLELSNMSYIMEFNKNRKLLKDTYFKILSLLYERNELVDSLPELQSIKDIINSIFKSFLVPNFRDVASVNPYIKPNVIYRSSKLTPHIQFKELHELIENVGIGTIIDLRFSIEIDKDPYPESFLKEHNISYFNIPLNPHTQSKDFKARYSHLTDGEEIAFRAFLEEHSSEIRKIMHVIAEVDTPILIHCYHGRDRTGIITAIIDFLSGAPLEIVKANFMTNQPSHKLYRFNLLIRYMHDKNSTIDYLKNVCNVPEHIINRVIAKISQNK